VSRIETINLLVSEDIVHEHYLRLGNIGDNLPKCTMRLGLDPREPTQNPLLIKSIISGLVWDGFMNMELAVRSGLIISPQQFISHIRACTVCFLRIKLEAENADKKDKE
jgi:hypothetical protein